LANEPEPYLSVHQSKKVIYAALAGNTLIAISKETMVQGDRRISHTNEVLNMHLGPDEVLLNASFDFIDGLPAQEVEQAISEFERRIKQQHPSVSRVFIEAQGWRAHAEDARNDLEEA
jgi:divalent metal cation (Fe/Co/Zn/Cd) transporter